jgi:hypothetical protein
MHADKHTDRQIMACTTPCQGGRGGESVACHAMPHHDTTVVQTSTKIDTHLIKNVPGHVTEPDLRRVVATTNQVPGHHNKQQTKHFFKRSPLEEPVTNLLTCHWRHWIFPFLKFLVIILFLVIVDFTFTVTVAVIVVIICLSLHSPCSPFGVIPKKSFPKGRQLILKVLRMPSPIVQFHQENKHCSLSSAAQPTKCIACELVSLNSCVFHRPF